MNRKATGAFRLMALSCAVLAWSPTFGATYDQSTGYVRLLGSNAGNSGESTFMTNILRSSHGWSDLRDPHSGTNYYCGAQLCTPKVANGSYTFQGDRLVMAAGLRVLADGQSITVDDLVFVNGGFLQTAGAGYKTTLSGNLTIESNSSNPMYFQLGVDPCRYVVSAALKGASSAHCRAELQSGKSSVSQYVQIDDASQYEGTFEVRTGVRLKAMSDFGGTIVVTNGATLEASSGTTTVNALRLFEGAVIDLSAGGTLNVAAGLDLGGGVTIVAAPQNSVGVQALLSVPTSVCELDVNAFSVTTSGGGVWRTRVEVSGGLQTLCCERMTFSVYDATTGFVTHSSGTPDRNQFDEAGVWSDGRVPHSDTNYCSSRSLIMATNAVFQGRSLTMFNGGLFNIQGNGRHVTIGDLRVNSGTVNVNGYFTTAGSSSGRSYISGTMTVLSRVSDGWPFAFFGSTSDGQTWVSDQTIYGDEGSALVARGHFGSAEGAVNNYVELLGDLTHFHGTFIVKHNETLRLGSSAFPGTVRLDTAYSHLTTIAPENSVVKVGTLKTLVATSVDVPSTNSLNASALNVTGTLTKNGGGALGFASAISGSSASLRIAEGGVLPLSADAVGALPLVFSDGAALVVDGRAEADAGLRANGVDLTSATVTAEGQIAVKVLVDDLEAAVGVPVCKLTSEQSAALVPAMSVQAVCGASARRGHLVAVAAGGNVLVSADFRKLGLSIIVR
ncbi:MAG: hypothetical protein E7049_10740 [Lentisphaerae bacterium]|nr:hypothetical protein [Lentisphaerota bacterium]